MKLRTKLLLGQAPLALTVIGVGVTGAFTITALGESSGAILKDNYRSVLAAQRMKESAERMDSGALFIVAGRKEQGLRQSEEHRKRFEEELRVQESNITEVGEHA